MGRLLFGCLPVLALLAGAGLAQDNKKGPPPEEDPPAEVPVDAGKPYLVLDAGGHTAPVQKVLFTPDDKQVITISHDKTIPLEQYVIDRVQTLSKDEQHPTTAKPTLPPFPLAKP